MTSIEQTKVALPDPAGFRTRYRSEPGMIGHYPWTYADHQRRKYDRPECEYENLFTEGQVRDLIAAALADAEREGAEQMREAAAKLARRNPLHYGSGESAEEELAQAIEDLPLPTGERQVVHLSHAEIAEAFLSRCPAHLRSAHDARDMQARPDVMEMGRAIETAVLAANGLEVRRG